MNTSSMKILFLVTLFYLIFPLPVYAGGSTKTFSQTVTIDPTVFQPKGQLPSPTSNQDQQLFSLIRSVQASVNNQSGIFGNLWHDIFWTFLSIIIGGIVGGIVGLALVIITDILKTPILYCQKGSEADSPKNHPLGKWRIIHIRVRNKERKYKRIPINILTAFSTQAQIIIFNKPKNIEFSGKWGNTPQPIISGKVQPDMTFIPPKIDVYPSNGNDDEYQDVAVGIKYDGEDKFYGFCMQSYLHNNLKHLSLSLDKGIYKGKITLASQGKKYHFSFTVYNESSKMDDFHLDVG